MPIAAMVWMWSQSGNDKGIKGEGSNGGQLFTHSCKAHDHDYQWVDLVMTWLHLRQTQTWT